jgi:cation transport ATPase
VSAGSINLNGKLTVEVKRPGGETVMSDILCLVEEAQAREAPVQRLADKVHTHLCILKLHQLIYGSVAYVLQGAYASLHMTLHQLL